MYWYAKIVLVMVMLLVAAGVGYGVYTVLPEDSGPNVRTVSSIGGDGAAAIPEEEPSIEMVARDDGEIAAPMPSPQTFAQERKLELAAKHLVAGRLTEARKLAEGIIDDPDVAEFSALWFDTTVVLGGVTSKLLFSDAPSPEKLDYVVKRGDTLSGIAKRHGTTVRLIQRGNGLDLTSHLIYAGQHLRIFKADWRIKVSKSHNVLALYDGKRLLRIYRVGIGREDRTPAGRFIIYDKQFNPDWWRKGKKVPFGDKDNVLGTRWISLKATQDTNPALTGYGIHGTWQPETIGKAVSNGCVRMLNEQVEELFDVIPRGAEVVIVN